MEIPLEIGGFEGREVIFITPGLFSAPKLIVDGVPVEGKKGQYLLEDNVGTPVEIKVKPGLFDPMPKLEVDGSLIQLAPAIKWYEYVWTGIPVLLVLLGGCFGAMLGVIALHINLRVFRTDVQGLAKYAVTGAISLVTFVLYMILALILTIVFQ